MGWKDWPSWLKGGVIGAVLSLILLLLKPYLGMLSIFLQYFFIIPFLAVWALTGDNPNKIQVLIEIVGYYIAPMIFYFIIGALIGLWIGRSKVKKSKK